jgi:hypothetical protein
VVRRAVENVQVSKQVHFVITVDLSEGVPFIDDETYSARFSKSEEVWNTETSEWEDYGEEMELYYRALEILNTVPLAKD